MPLPRFTVPFLLLGILVWPTGTHLQAQSHQEAGAFRNLNRAEGLPRSSVFAIAQDSLGVMWFGTRGGVSKYDGHRFNLFQSGLREKSVDKNVGVLYVDPPTGDIWMGSTTDLIRYRQSTDEVKRFVHRRADPRGLTRGSIRCVFRDASGRLWVATSTGLNAYNPQTGAFERRDFPGRAGTSVTFIVQAVDATLYFGTRDGLYTLGQGSAATFKRAAVLAGRHLTAGHPAEDGSLWVGTETAGLFRWDPSRNALLKFTNDARDPASLSNNSVVALDSDAGGGLWVGTAEGLNYLPAGGGSFVRYRSSGQKRGELHDDFIKSLLIDRTGKLWVGTYYSGVQRFDERYNLFNNYRHDPHQNSLSGNIVSAFAETPAGHLYVGTEGDGLNLLNSETGRFEHYRAGPGSISGNNVKRLLLDGGDLWIGTWQAGLNRFDTLRKTFTHYHHDPDDTTSLAHENTYALHREGNFLWVATYGGGLDVMDVGRATFRHFRHDPENPNSLSSDLARTILKESDGVFWVGTNAGLNRITTDSSGYPAGFERFFASEKIYVTYLAEDGTLWFGTSNNGLFAYHPRSGEVTTYTSADGLSGNTVFGILPAGNGDIWVSTENGLSALSTATGSFSNYDHSNGLQNKEYNFHAYYRTQNGKLLFGGLSGFTAFDPTDLRPEQRSPPLIVSGLLRNGVPVRVGDGSGLLDRDVNEVEKIAFDYGESVFTVQFAALDYFSPENNRYAYKLEGLDRQWHYQTGKGEVSYTIQREGTYELLLKVAAGDGSWHEPARSIRIEVLPPPHRSWWAYLLYAALLVSAGLLVAYFIRVRHRFELQEVARRQQEELTEMKLRFFTNITHEFRTPLTLILGPLQQLLGAQDRPAGELGQLSLVKRNADRLLNLVNQILTFRKLVTDHEPLRAERTAIGPLVENVFAAFQDLARQRGIEYVYHNRAPADLALWLDVDKLEKVLYNLLSNAFKFTPEGGTIRLRLSSNRVAAFITVEDSGPGIAPNFRNNIFKRFYEKSNGQTSTIKNSGIGLAISREMIKLHGGELDLVDPTGDGAAARLGGAVFTIRLPLGRGHLRDTEISEGTQRGLAPIVPVAPVTATSAAAEGRDDGSSDGKARPRLLIVDDNRDMLRYLKSVLDGTYAVAVAENGRAGLAAARQSPPEAIISDVMMPEMDGLAFCDAVKTDLAISHVPVILLTAQTATTYRIQGLRNGADGYLTKPFNPTELLLRVRNLLRARRQSQRQFVTKLTVEPAEITITDTDEEFLRTALAVVEERMGDSEFRVEDFALALAVSRSLLYTKIGALTDQTPSNFIKTLRLKRAAQLLQSGQMNVSEVTYAVGFRDTKHFRKCFKLQFGELPSNYRKVTN